VAALTIGALVAAACSGDDDATETTPTTPTTVPETAPATTEPAEETGPASTSTTTTEVVEGAADAETIAAIEAAIEAAPEGCDPLDTRQCLFPYPSNALTERDRESRTDRMVVFPEGGTPVNASGVPVDPTQWNRNDGFSINSTLLTHVARLDPVASDLPRWTHLDDSLAEDATVVLVDTSTGERVPLWAEHDAKIEDPEEQLLVIHPAVVLEPATTYAVGIRGLVTIDGDPVEPSPVFRVLRDDLDTGIDAIEDRRDELEDAFEALATVGVPREELQLAWTFTTISTENVTERMLAIRDRALFDLADRAPEFEITEVVDAPDLEGIARQVVGTYTVTNFLTGEGGPGAEFNYDANDLPEVNGTVQSPFVCNIPEAVMAGDAPGRMVQYGHGLLGSHFEINASNVRAMSNEHRAVYCATKWAGMSEDDVANAVDTLNDFSRFHTMADRLQQGVLQQLELGRLMRAGDGLAADPAFQRADGSPLLDNSALYYDGNSQGGIMGIMLAALSRDFERAVLGVPGMNYSLLLPRSVDFDTYEAVMVPAYPDPVDRALLIAMVQMLWDRGEGAGYVQHVTDDTFTDTPAKRVLLHVAFGDWQVTELSAFIAARAMGVPIHRPVTADERSREAEPGWGLESVVYPASVPAEGDGDGDDPVETSTSAIIVWDSGSDPIPFDQLPPRSSRDSHEDPRADALVRQQKAAFLFDGVLIDVCAGGPCTVPPRD
jgi:hypothetical protein